MKSTEFIALLIANSNKTRNLRTYAGKWYSGAPRVPDSISTQIGHIVALIQAKINEGLICDRQQEGLLIYNFQPIIFSQKQLYCGLDMLIRPLKDIDNTHLKTGTPLQIIINGNTSEVMNMTKGLLEVGLITMDEVTEESMEQSLSYGKYIDYPAICSFLAICSQNPLDIQSIFEGKLDRTTPIQTCTGYDSFVEAQQVLLEKANPYCYVAELIYSKEQLSKFLDEGIGKHLLKIINLQQPSITVTPNPQVAKEEARIEDQVRLYNEAILEPKFEE